MAWQQTLWLPPTQVLKTLEESLLCAKQFDLLSLPKETHSGRNITEKTDTTNSNGLWLFILCLQPAPPADGDQTKREWKVSWQKPLLFLCITFNDWSPRVVEGSLNICGSCCNRGECVSSFTGWPLASVPVACTTAKFFWKSNPLSPILPPIY